MSTCVEALSYTLCWHPGKKRKSGRTRLQFIAAFHGPEYNNRLCWKQNVMSQRHETATIRRHSFKTQFVIVWRLLCTVYMWWRDDRTNSSTPFSPRGTTKKSLLVDVLLDHTTCSHVQPSWHFSLQSVIHSGAHLCWNWGMQTAWKVTGMNTQRSTTRVCTSAVRCPIHTESCRICFAKFAHRKFFENENNSRDDARAASENQILGRRESRLSEE